MAASKSTDTTAVADKVTRPRKSPQEKAQADLEKYTARHAKALVKVDNAHEALTAAETELAEAQRWLTFAQGSKHLPAQAQDEVAAEPVQAEELFTVNS